MKHNFGWFKTFSNDRLYNTRYLIPGKQIKWLKSKDMPDRCIHILEIRDIDGTQFVTLTNRQFYGTEMTNWADTLIQKEPYTSDEDLKKFEMYNE